MNQIWMFQSDFVLLLTNKSPLERPNASEALSSACLKVGSISAVFTMVTIVIIIILFLFRSICQILIFLIC